MKLTCLIASIVLIVCINQHSIHGAPIDDLTTVHPCLEGFELVGGQCLRITFTTQSSETESVSFKLQNSTLPDTVVTEESKKLNGPATFEDQFATTFEPKQFDKTPVEHDTEPLVHTDKPEEHNNELFHYTSEPTKHETETFDYTTESLQHDNEPLTHTDKPEEHDSEPFDYTTESFQHDIKSLTYTDKPEEHENEIFDYTTESLQHDDEPLVHTDKPEEHDSELFDYTTESFQHDIKSLTYTDKPEEHDNEPLDHTSEPVEHKKKPSHRKSASEDHENESLDHTTEPEEHDNEQPLDYTSEPQEYEKKPSHHINKPKEDESEPLDHTTEPVEDDNEVSRPTGKSKESKNESSDHTGEKTDETDLPKGCPAGTKPDEQGACEDEADHKSTTVAIDLKTLLSKDGKCPDGMALYGKKCVYMKSKQSLEKKPMDDSNDFETNTIDKDNGEGKLTPLLPGNLCPGDSEYYSNGLCRLRTGSSTIKPLPPNNTECLAGEILVDGECTKKEIKSKFPMKSTTESSKTNEVDSETEPVERKYRIYKPKSKIIKS